jgi:6-pyruvoyltetrahydropterin/6-carboxytetrahydropterin synthase
MNAGGVVFAVRYHDISTGHRVCGHESKCAHLHGHNYRIHFHCVAEQLDCLGRVIDFSAIKARLCLWLEEHWDHRFLLWEHDPLAAPLRVLDPTVVLVPFNPTAENMAVHLVEVIAPLQLAGTGVRLTACEIEETRKCSARYATHGRALGAVPG